jgi:peptidoglycan L-alanyl-D-glutamate endopeptidase CwlK
MAFKLGSTSLARLKGVHPDLVKVVQRAIEITPIDFTVLEGLRTRDRQKKLVARGASKTMNSYHLTGHAVDIAPLVEGKVTWDWKYYHQLAPAVKQAAEELGINITWGGDWKTFKDGPHWQIPR